LHEENVFLGYAASSRNVEILQLFLQNDDVDKLNIVCNLFGAPPLHLVVEQTVLGPWADPQTFDDWVHCNDFINIELLEKNLPEKDLEKDSAIANTIKLNMVSPI